MLVPFVIANDLGYVYVNSAISKDESWLIPDVLVRRSAPPKTAWTAVPTPVLVVEVLSPTTRRRDREFKRPFYIDDVRVPAYWIVDREGRSITVVRVDGLSVVSTGSLTWSLPGIDAQLEVQLDSVFGPP